MADREKAMEWYDKAGVDFHKAGKLDDARVMLQALHNLATHYPAVMQLVTELEKLVETSSKRRQGRNRLSP
jgi:hypothetical protein